MSYTSNNKAFSIYNENVILAYRCKHGTVFYYRWSVNRNLLLFLCSSVRLQLLIAFEATLYIGWNVIGQNVIHHNFVWLNVTQKVFMTACSHFVYSNKHFRFRIRAWANWPISRPHRLTKIRRQVTRRRES